MYDNFDVQSTNLIELSQTVDQISKLIVDIAREQRPVLGGEHYLSDAELSSRLKISRRTLQQWRNDGLISFIALGGKVLYRESDIEEMLKNCYRKAFDIER